jgi:serine/threonine-protein kinase
MGVRSYALLAAAILLTVGASTMKLLASRRPDLDAMHPVAYGSYLCNVLALVCIGTGFGPLLFMPTLLTAFNFAYCMTYRSSFRVAVIATGAVRGEHRRGAELAGLVPPSYAFRDGAMIILPRGVTLDPLPTLVALVVSSVFMVIVPGILMARIQGTLQQAEQRAFLQAWRLENLLPDEARAPS